MTTTLTPPGAPIIDSLVQGPREATSSAERATRDDWERVTAHLGSLPGSVAGNAWAVLGQFLTTFEGTLTAPRRGVVAGQRTRSIEGK